MSNGILDGPALIIETEQLVGRTGRYTKHLHELAGLYADSEAFDEALAADPERLMYYVDDFRPSVAPGDLITGISTLLPGTIGEEFSMPRGHIHAQHDRTEIYHCLSGHGLMLMETLDGQTVVTELKPG